MPDAEKSLAEAIEAVVQKFDFDGTMAAECAEVLVHIDDRAPTIAAAYWTYWAGMQKFEELENPRIRDAMVSRTATFIVADSLPSSYGCCVETSDDSSSPAISGTLCNSDNN